MIASLSGKVQHVGLDRVVLDVSGVGMLVLTTPATAAALRHGQQAQVSTTLVVREESLTLYGFVEDADRDLFEQVQTVSGVGPRLALAMLSVYSGPEIATVIGSGDVVALTKVPGIGKKGAERLILELRDKMALLAVAPAGGQQPVAATADATSEQVQEALVGLGWSAKQAQDAVTKVRRDAQAPDDVAALLRAALRELGR